MSAPYGFSEEDRQRDFPDLNKCPDCETFFAALNCPLCGKECPEEMRAGNRKPIKQKRFSGRGNGNGRVVFVPWYLSTWFTLFMLFFQPVIGLILTWMGYWKKHWKIIVTVLVVFYYVGYAFLIGLIGGIFSFFHQEKIPVNTELAREDYIALCETVDAEDLYRRTEEYADEYVCMTLTVDDILTDELDYESDYLVYYRCHIEQNGKAWEFLVRDWRQTDQINLIKGDVITVYGQVAGNLNIYAASVGDLTKPGIHMLYCEVVPENTTEILAAECVALP